MPFGTATLLAGGALASGIGGAIAGASGTPDQSTTSSSTSTSNRTFGAMTPEQQQLQQQSLQNYMQQLALAGQYEQGMGSAGQFQDLARQTGQGILGGEAFQATPQELAAIEARRAATVGQSEADVNKLLDQRMGQLSASAGQRGVRGQAYSQLQTGALQAGSEQFGAASRAAALQAAQEQTSIPLQRIGAQQNQIAQGMSLLDQMRLQAQQNRINAQNPYLLQQMQNERAGTGTTTQSQSGTNTTPGQEGGFWSGVGGAISGAAGGLNIGGNIASGIANTSLANQMRQNLASQQPTPTYGGGSGGGYGLGGNYNLGR